MFTLTEQGTLSELLQEAHHTLENYLSLAQNCLMARALPVLTESHEFVLFEIYCAFQTLAKFEEKYSKNLIPATVKACKIQIMFNPREQ